MSSHWFSLVFLVCDGIIVGPILILNAVNQTWKTLRRVLTEGKQSRWGTTASSVGAYSYTDARLRSQQPGSM